MIFENLPSTNTPINATNLNKNASAIQSTQPTHGEEVWFQTGSNKKIKIKNSNGTYDDFLSVDDENEYIMDTSHSELVNQVTNSKCIKKGNFVYVNFSCLLNQGTIGVDVYEIARGLPIPNLPAAVQIPCYVWTSSGGKSIRTAVGHASGTQQGKLMWYYNTSVEVQNNSVLVINGFYPIN